MQNVIPFPSPAPIAKVAAPPAAITIEPLPPDDRYRPRLQQFSRQLATDRTATPGASRIELRQQANHEPISRIRAYQQQLAQLITRLEHDDPTLLEIYFEGIHLDRNQDMQALLEALPHHTHLLRLSLTPWINDRQALCLVEALKSNSRLRTLELCRSVLGTPTLKLLAMICAQHGHLSELNLGYSGLEANEALVLTETLAGATQLRTLDLNDNLLRSIGAERLVQALQRQPVYLSTLKLGGNRIGDAGAYALRSLLAANPSLTHLKLDHNEIGDTGVHALSGPLLANTSLTRLDLGHNGIGRFTHGIAALGIALSHNSSLIRLSLRGNPLGDYGARSLAPVLARNSGLTTLVLSDCGIGSPGAKALAHGLAYNFTLTALDLGLNDIGDSGATALAATLARSDCVANIDLFYNDRISREVLRALAEARARNRCLVALSGASDGAAPAT